MDVSCQQVLLRRKKLQVGFLEECEDDTVSLEKIDLCPWASSEFNSFTFPAVHSHTLSVSPCCCCVFLSLSSRREVWKVHTYSVGLFKHNSKNVEVEKKKENQNTFHFHVPQLSFNFLLSPALPRAAADPVNFPTRSCIRVRRLSKRKSKYFKFFFFSRV